MQNIKILSCIIVLLTISGCVNNKSHLVLSDLKEFQSKESRHNEANTKKFKEDAIIETGISIGAQAGLAHETKQINLVLKKYSAKLDDIFNFNRMLLNNNVLCPVLVKSNNNFHLDPNGDKIRIADETYMIVKQARFVTAAPNWREYLQHTYPEPSRPDNSLLPSTSSERKVWRDAVTKGWEHGIKQARNIFSNNLNKLTQDFKGMVLYKYLLTKKMVTEPSVGMTSLGITGSNSELRVNDQVLRITALPKIQTNSEEWQPIVVQK